MMRTLWLRQPPGPIIWVGEWVSRSQQVQRLKLDREFIKHCHTKSDSGSIKACFNEVLTSFLIISSSIRRLGKIAPPTEELRSTPFLRHFTGVHTSGAVEKMTCCRHADSPSWPPVPNLMSFFSFTDALWFHYGASMKIIIDHLPGWKSRFTHI